MTPRSPTKQPQPKTTTISRRLRNRADQDLSVQPPELPQLRGLRARRAATLPSNRRTPATFPTQEAHLNDWNGNLNSFSRSQTSHPADLAHSNLLLQEALDIATYQSPRDASSSLVSLPSEEPSYQVHPTTPADLLPSPLPSLSGSHTATEFDYTEPPHDPSLDLQDMRYGLHQRKISQSSPFQHSRVHDGSCTVRYGASLWVSFKHGIS